MDGPLCAQYHHWGHWWCALYGRYPFTLEVHLDDRAAGNAISNDFARAGGDIYYRPHRNMPAPGPYPATDPGGWRSTGRTLNPATPLAVLEEVLHLVKMVLVMTVNPGFGGQKMIPIPWKRYAVLSPCYQYVVWIFPSKWMAGSIRVRSLSGGVRRRYFGDGSGCFSRAKADHQCLERHPTPIS